MMHSWTHEAISCTGLVSSSCSHVQYIKWVAFYFVAFSVVVAALTQPTANIPLSLAAFFSRLHQQTCLRLMYRIVRVILFAFLLRCGFVHVYSLLIFFSCCLFLARANLKRCAKHTTHTNANRKQSEVGITKINRKEHMCVSADTK